MKYDSDDDFWVDCKSLLIALQAHGYVPSQTAQVLIGALALLTGMNSRKSNITLDDFLADAEVKELIADGLKLGHRLRPG